MGGDNMGQFIPAEDAIKRMQLIMEQKRRLSAAIAYGLLRTETTVYASYLDRAEDMVEDVMRIL